jgi:hypothetical protein
MLALLAEKKKLVRKFLNSSRTGRRNSRCAGKIFAHVCPNISPTLRGGARGVEQLGARRQLRPATAAHT